MYKLLGFLLVGLATLGLALPGLPTTPFVLLAAWCFSKTSKKWHAWLMANPAFGPLLKNWEERHCIARGTKTLALVMVTLFGTLSVGFLLESFYLRLFVTVFLLWGFFFVARLPTCPVDSEGS